MTTSPSGLGPSPAERALAQEVSDLKALLQATCAELADVRKNAERDDRDKNQFLSRMSHELRTPLNAILGFGQMMEMDEMPAAQREALDHILRAGNHLLGLVNQILDIARLEANQLAFQPETVAVGELLREVFALVQPLSTRYGGVLHVPAADIASGVLIKADRDRLKQVLVELLTNAIKFNRDGGDVRAEVKIAGPVVHLTIFDQGSGLTAEQIGRLFIPFRRLADERQIEGSGVGLSLAQRLAKAMHGVIRAESTPGEGSAFTLEMPLATDTLAPAKSPQSMVSSATARLLLCIEDDPTNAKLVEVFLRGDSNIKVMGVPDGTAGLKLAADLQPDLLIIDMALPDMTGHDILARLKEEPSTRSIPVICVSANEDPAEVRRALGAGAIRYLAKPLNRNSFVALVSSVLKRAPVPPPERS